MTLCLLSLNTGGCSSSLKNSAIRVYIEKSGSDPDVVFLQETNFLKSSDICWKTWPYKIISSEGKHRGSGVTTLVKTNENTHLVSSEDIFHGCVIYVSVEANDNLYHLYNILMPQNNDEAVKALEAIENHCNKVKDGVIILGGDFNCTHNPSFDRFCNPIENRKQIALALQNLHNSLSLCDIWRRLNPDSRRYTWFRSNPLKPELMSKARLDRFYIPETMTSSVIGCDFYPCPLSDHSAVAMTFQVHKKQKRGSPYWHFNNSLLEDNDYIDSITLFWKRWQLQKSDYDNICTWWDMGKAQIKQITQLYGSKVAQEKRIKIQKLQDSIDLLQAAPDSTPENLKTLKEQRDALSELFKNEARGALVRARFQYTNEIDTCSNYFFNLEKSISSSKYISRIRLPCGDIVEDPDKIRTHIRNFYRDLYSLVETDQDAQETLLKDLPSLDLSDSEDCDRPLSPEEVDVAIRQLSQNKSPGLDGLTSEFYQCFWPIIREDLIAIFEASIHNQILPVSFRRAVITLLPKKGDLLDITNWRPVSLLNVDYKIFAKVLANRLKSVIGNVIHTDQSYTIPERSIYNNINLIRDVLLYANYNNLPLAILNLDQKKAFDNVDKEYLFKTMKAMGFGDYFTSCVKLLYNGTESLLKVCGSLTCPFPFAKGIRQGCPLSGLLYSIAIEPLLQMLRRNMGNNGLVMPDSDTSLTVSAYADDISIFVGNDQDFDIVDNVYKLYSRASAASLNYHKSQGLWVGSWINRIDHPLGFKWNNQGLKFLGVHLGNSNNYTQQNWQMCQDKLTKALGRWKGLSKFLSYKGKVLIANQLATSQILHTLAVLSPPDHILNELQNKLINFIWSDGRHWLKKQLLFQTPDKGGLGLACLQARMLTFRFAIIQKLLKDPAHQSFHFIKYYLHQFRGLKFDFQLFCTDLDLKYIVNLPTFHGDILRAWVALGARITAQPDSIHFMYNLPLNAIYFSEFTKDGQTLLSPRLLACGIRLVGDVIDDSGKWHTAQYYRDHMRHPPSARILQAELVQLQAVLVRACPHLFNSTGYRLSASHLRNIPPVPNSKLEIQITSDSIISDSPSKVIYDHMNQQLNYLDNRYVSYWHKNGVIPAKQIVPWKQIYSLPTTKKEADAQFRLLHNILPNLTVLHHIDTNISPSCGWCGKRGTTIHLFIECPAIQPALNLLHAFLHKIMPNVHLNFDVYWSLLPHARGRSKEAVNIFNYLIMSLKFTIYNLYLKQSFDDPLLVWTYRIKCKILIEFHYYSSQNNVPKFIKKWSHNRSLFELDNTHSLLNWLF